MAKKKSTGSLRNGRDSCSKRLGVKVFGNQIVYPGSIIIRQHGTKFIPKYNCLLGRDYTIYSIVFGRVVYKHRYVYVYNI